MDSLLKDVLRVHPPVVLGQFDGEDDTGNEEDGAAPQAEPEGVLEDRSRTKAFTPGSTGRQLTRFIRARLCVSESDASEVLTHRMSPLCPTHPDTPRQA